MGVPTVSFAGLAVAVGDSTVAVGVALGVRPAVAVGAMVAVGLGVAVGIVVAAPVRPGAVEPVVAVGEAEVGLATAISAEPVTRPFPRGKYRWRGLAGHPPRPLQGGLFASPS